jgi:hypothetical protein
LCSAVTQLYIENSFVNYIENSFVNNVTIAARGPTRRRLPSGPSARLFSESFLRAVSHQTLGDSLGRDLMGDLAHRLFHAMRPCRGDCRVAGFNCLRFDPLPFQQDGPATPEADVGRGEISNAPVISQMIVVADKGFNLPFKITGEIIVLRR